MLIDDRKAKIKWQCRRGMLELDLMLNRFTQQCLNQLNEQQLITLEKLLGNNDPELYAWLMGQEIPTEKELQDFVKFIQMHN